MDTNNKNLIKLVTHNGSFHADDIFAASLLSLMLDKNGKTYEIVRTRDPEIINNGNYVFDVGGVYDPENNRFDHHQVGGAGKHENGIEYASFGLVWEKFGEEVCQSKEIASFLEKKIVAPIDANDNGVNIYDLKGELSPYTIQDIFMCFMPSWKEDDDYDKPFLELVDFAKKIISREIQKTGDAFLAESLVRKDYENSVDKRLIILNGHYPWGEIIQSYSLPLYVVSPKDDNWRLECVRKQKYSFENRKNLPESWGGLREEELQKITGVQDAIFCHRALFLAVAKSKEGAIKLAELALLDSNNYKL
jgi:uncharacterized UPF0160 family protein